MASLKKDAEARSIWGEVYDVVPKSVFAVAVWHLSDQCGDGDWGGAARRFAEEIEALSANGLIDEAQANRALKAMQSGGMLS